MRILAIIPARGGSKSVPRKNVKLLAGQPLIAYSVKAALASRLTDRVVVTTDDDEIRAAAENCGAEVPFVRPPELALDHTTDLPVFQHCLRWLLEHENYQPDTVVHLRPTAPLRTREHIDRGIQLLIESPESDSVRSVCAAGQHPLKMWGVENHYLQPFVPESLYDIPEAYNQPRQKLPRAFVQNGSVDVIRTGVILEKNSMTGKVIKAMIMDEVDSINIDGPLDWHLAEILMTRRLAHETRLPEKDEVTVLV